MKDEQIEFYSSIAKYYQEIFPFNPAQLGFVKQSSEGVSGKKILDIGCATGELAFQLAVAGADVTGIDLNEDLLFQAKEKNEHPLLNFQTGDMMKLKDNFPARHFDIVICFGNTLVHLPSTAMVKNMFYDVHHIIKPGGKFLIQILHYDYILSENIKALPIIETDKIKFVRRYIIEKNNPLIRFNTKLYIKKEEKVIENETHLLALESNELKRMLQIAGFEGVEFFAGFKMENYGGNHFPLVIKSEIVK
jgi:glycine/sarcosine N-methyltransferase